MCSAALMLRDELLGGTQTKQTHHNERSTTHRNAAAHAPQSHKTEYHALELGARQVLTPTLRSLPRVRDSTHACVSQRMSDPTNNTGS